MAKRQSVKSTYIIVDDHGDIVYAWFRTAKLAWEYVDTEDIEEHTGPVRVFRFAAQDESRRP